MKHIMNKDICIIIRMKTEKFHQKLKYFNTKQENKYRHCTLSSEKPSFLPMVKYYVFVVLYITRDKKNNELEITVEREQ